MRLKLKHFWYEIARRGTLILVLLLFAVVVLFIWFLVTGFSQSQPTIIIAIAAISAFFAAVSSIAAFIQASEAQRQREKQERPYVSAFFDGSNSGLIYFEIQNAGNSPAVNITFNFDPAPINSAGRNLSEVSIFQKPISFMPPGKMYRQIIDAGHQFLAEGKPTKYIVKVLYYSIAGEKFDEKIEYDLAYLKQATVPGKTIEENLTDISKQLDEIRKILASVRGINAFLVESPDEHQARMMSALDNEHRLPRWKVLLRKVIERLLKKLD